MFTFLHKVDGNENCGRVKQIEARPVRMEFCLGNQTGSICFVYDCEFPGTTCYSNLNFPLTQKFVTVRKFLRIAHKPSNHWKIKDNYWSSVKIMSKFGNKNFTVPISSYDFRRLSLHWSTLMHVTSLKEGHEITVSLNTQAINLKSYCNTVCCGKGCHS